MREADWIGTCRCFLLNLLPLATLRHVVVLESSTSSSSNQAGCMCVWMCIHLVLFLLLLLRAMLLITDIYTSIKITQAYRLNHLIDYLVCLSLSPRSFAFELDFNFALSFLTTIVRLFAFSALKTTTTKKDWWLSFSICSWKPIIKRLHLLCNRPIEMPEIFNVHMCSMSRDSCWTSLRQATDDLQVWLKSNCLDDDYVLE